MRVRYFASLTFLAAALIGCGGSSAPAALLISPATIVGAPGQLVPVHVFLRRADGALEDVTAHATLTASDAAVAAIEPGGVRVNAAGDAALVARARGLAAWTRIEAADGADVGGLTIAPANLMLAQGHALPLVISGAAPDGSTLDLTGAATFSIDDPRVAALLVDGAVRIYGIAPGSVTVSATVGAHTAATTVQVVPYATTRKLTSVELSPRDVQTRIGRAAQLYAAGRYDDGTVEDVTPRAVWRHDGGAIDRIIAGTLLPARGGTTQVTASVEGLSDSVTVAVTDLSQPEMRPALMQLPVGGSQTLSFFAHYTDGLVYDLTAAADWTSDAPSLASVSGGTVQGVANGTTAVHALAFGRDAVAAITVGDVGSGGGTLIALAITPPFATVGPGGSQIFRAVASYSDGSQQTLAGGVSWTAGAGASIDGNGLATALTPGTYAITASYAGLQTAATLTMSGVAANPTSLSVTSPTVTLSVGGTRALVATAQYDDGTTRDVTTSVQWSSSSSSSSIAAGGLLTANQTGTAVITAQLGTLTATSQVTVQPALTGVTVYPTGGASVASGLTVALTATANYSDGSMVDITNSATWTTGNSAIATVSTGHATGHAVGTTQVLATYNGRTAQTQLTVTAAKVTSLTVSGPSSVTCQSGNYALFTATATFTDGTQRDVSTSTASPQVTWQLSGLTGYPGLYATLYSDEIYCSSTCSTTCTYRYAYGSITARALNDDGTSVTSAAWSFQALYMY